jgi:hypothetical protein
MLFHILVGGFEVSKNLVIKVQNKKRLKPLSIFVDGEKF